MKPILLAFLLPGLLWKSGTPPSDLDQRVRVYKTDEAVSAYTTVPAPKSQMRMSAASATTVPWVDANGWRFERGLKKAFYKSLPAGSAALALAEAFAYDGDAIVEPAAEDAAATTSMLKFLQSQERPKLPVLANIGVVDDGSAQLGEVLNLLGRRNLLYKVVAALDPKLDLTVQIGSKQYPISAIQNPNDFAARVREQLSDEKRLLRLFNTYTVIGRLTGEKDHIRLHLLNYSPKPAQDFRVRVLGVYETVHLADSTDPQLHAADVAIQEGGTEFTVPSLKTYAIIDMERKR